MKLPPPPCMANQGLIAVPYCPFRVGTSCAQPVIKRMRGEENAGTTLAEAIALCANLLTRADVIEEVLKTCPACPMVKGFRCRHTPLTPRWDGDNLTLWVGQFKALEFDREAHSEMAVVEIYEREHWLTAIKHPFGEDSGAVHAGWLRNAICHLNKRQKERLFWMVWFRRHAIRQEICWEYKIPLNET